MEFGKCIVSPSANFKPVHVGFPENEEITDNCSRSTRRDTKEMLEAFSSCKLSDNEEYITLLNEEDANNSVVDCKQSEFSNDTICKRAKYVGNFHVNTGDGLLVEKDLCLQVAKGITEILQKTSLPYCHPVYIIAGKEKLEICSLVSEVKMLEIVVQEMVYVKSEPQHAVFSVCTRQLSSPTVEVHVFKVTSPHEATKIGQLLENQQAGQQKSHSVLSCSSTTQTARDCTSSSKRHTPNPLRKGSSVSTPSVFEKSHSLPQLMRSRPFPATKRSYSSCTISHTLSHQQLQLSPVMQRRVSSESPVDDDDCKPCRPKANTLFSKHSAAKSFKKVVNSPPPIPTRQTCGDIKSKIASLEEDIALMQVQLTKDSGALKEASKAKQVDKDELGMMKMRIHSRKKSLQGKMESFRRYHCLLKATIETNPDMVSVKDCYGRNWFKPDWNRNSAEKALSSKPSGCFFVRESTTKENSYVLSMKDGVGAVVHHLILRAGSSYHLKGAEHAAYKTLIDLIVHLTNKREVLPCTLVTLETPVWGTPTELEEESEYILVE